MAYQEIETPAPARPMDTYTVSTPFGTVIISDGGRKVAFELYSDIRQSRHNQALFTYIRQLQKQGVSQFNTDHITIAGTAIQLKELAKHCERLIVLVPRGKMEEMSTILHMINLDQCTAIEPYDSFDDED
ncbi:hypothetical protein ES705_45283 [subsurface metagenome]